MYSELVLRGVVIFADHARDGAFSADIPQVRHIADRLRFDVRRALIPGLVRPVAVVAEPGTPRAPSRAAKPQVTGRNRVFERDTMPVVRSIHDKRVIVTRLRYVMEDPAAQIATAGMEFVLDQLSANGNRPELVERPSS